MECIVSKLVLPGSAESWLTADRRVRPVLGVTAQTSHRVPVRQRSRAATAIHSSNRAWHIDVSRIMVASGVRSRHRYQPSPFDRTRIWQLDMAARWSMLRQADARLYDLQAVARAALKSGHFTTGRAARNGRRQVYYDRELMANYHKLQSFRQCLEMVQPAALILPL